VGVPFSNNVSNQRLMCCLCVDLAIRDGEKAEPIREAFTFAPVPQVVTVGGNPSAFVVALPVCYECRASQLKPVSKSGLVTV